MIAEQPSEIVLASAGSGKTFRLTLRLLSLLLRGVPIDRILASTFTRKAAGEIFDRLLNQLALAATNDDERKKLADNLRRLGVGLEVTDSLVMQTLSDFIERLDRVRIQTLDSFFARLAKATALELSVAPGWTIAEEHEDALLREEAAERALSDIGEAERLILLDMLSTKPVAGAFRTMLLDSIAACHGWLWLAGNRLDPLLAIVPEHAPLADDELSTLLADLSVAPVRATANGTQNANWLKARDSVIECSQTGYWDGVLGKALVANSVAAAPTFYGKPIEHPLLGLLQRLHAHALSCVIGKLAERNRSAGVLALGFDRHYRELQRSHGLLRFDDIPRLIGEAHSADRLLDALYALDGAIDHLLLDEYQDTSTIQERLLLPIMDELQAQGDRSVFVVGDIKQSLYGWRQAEPELLETLGDRRSLDATTLEKSWRCSPAVIEVVNRVFEGIAGCPQMGDGPAKRVAERWQHRFVPHEAERSSLQGSVHAEIGPRNLGQRLELAAQRVADLADASKHATIAVLFRGNAGVQAMIERLAALGVRASEEGGGTITDTPAVRSAVSLLRLACHPGDTMSGHVALHGPFGARYRAADPTSGETARRVSAEVRREIARDGCAGLVESLIDHAQDQMTPRERARMEQLLAMAWQVDARGAGPAELAALACEAQRPLSSPDRVRVMTVHKAKGLEFDAVVLPDLDWPLGPKSGGMLIGRSSIGGPVEQMSLCPSRDIAMLHPKLRRLYEQHAERTISEGLSILYVAMTRARVRLDMFLAEPPKDGTSPTAAAVVRSALDLSTEEQPFAYEDGDWTEGVKPPEEPPPRSRPERRPLALTHPTRLRTGRLARRAPSGAHALSARELLSPATEAMTRGERWHGWFEAIEWLDRAPALADLPGSDTHPAEARAFLATLDGPIGEALRKRSLALDAGESARVHREWAFAVRIEDEHGAALVTGRIDRLTVIHDARGGPARAIVDDLKTDALADDGAAGIVERHRGQLALYRRAVAQALRLDAKAVRTRLMLAATGTVEEVA